jgi:hypothetical protein
MRKKSESSKRASKRKDSKDRITIRGAKQVATDINKSHEKVPVAKKIKANEDRIAKKLDRIAKGLPVEDVKPVVKPKAKKKVVAKKSKKSK